MHIDYIMKQQVWGTQLSNNKTVRENYTREQSQTHFLWDGCDPKRGKIRKGDYFFFLKNEEVDMRVVERVYTNEHARVVDNSSNR